MGLRFVKFFNGFFLALLLIQLVRTEPDVDSNTVDDVTVSHRELEVVAENRTEVDIPKNRTDNTNTAIAFDSGRQFPGIIGTISGFGSIGNQLANILKAIFIDPPLGPYFCFIFGTCEDNAEELEGRSFEDMGPVLNSLWKVYEKYNSPVAPTAT